MKRSCGMFIVLFATVFAGDGHAQTNPAIYVARTIQVAPQARESYLACLRSTELPVWRDLKKQGLLADQSVYETTRVLTVEKDVPEWNFLLLSHVAPLVSPQSFVAAEDKRLGASPKSSRCADMSGATTQRLEVLRSTPNSYYPRVYEDDDRVALKENVSYAIEYIAVHDTPEALNQYRENMRPTTAQLPVSWSGKRQCLALWLWRPSPSCSRVRACQIGIKSTSMESPQDSRRKGCALRGKRPPGRWTRAAPPRETPPYSTGFVPARESTLHEKFSIAY